NRSPGQLKRTREFLRLVKTTEDPYLLGFAYYYLADICFLKGRSGREYTELVTKAIPFLKEVENSELLARSYNLLGINALNNGNFQLGLDFFLNGLDFVEDDRPDLKAMILYNIGQIYDLLGNKKTALSYFREGKKLAKKVGIRKNLFLYMHMVCAEGSVCLDLGREKAANRCAEDIQRLMTVHPDFTAPRQNLYALSFGIRMSHLRKEYEDRDALLDIFFSILEKGEFQTDAISEINIVGKFLAEAGLPERQARLIELCEPFARDSDSGYITMSYAKTMLEYYSIIGDREKYDEMLEVYFQASKKHDEESNTAYIYALSLRQKMKAIEEENLRLQKQAVTDALTGLSNRFKLNDEMDRIFARACEEQKTLAIEILDVDYFKEYNDTYGHQAGDAALVAVADVIRRITETYWDPSEKEREVLTARYGGDEFVIIYLGYSDEEVIRIANEMRQEVYRLNLKHGKNDVADRITISQGIRNSVPVEENRVWDYLYAADNALYKVKKTKKGEIELLHKAVIADSSFNDATHG
ncbi:MAG: GGDEF domain-containing protein, partial [Lachnospiraceae bacterium]|nr:GGDEF domain-containing protein [Lachnospiraceae bacterium]